MQIRTRTEALKILGFLTETSEEQIKSQYKNLSKKFHPDVVGEENAEYFYKVNEAYNFLMNNPPVVRKVYGTNSKAVAHVKTQRNNREIAQRQKVREEKRKKQKQAELEKAAFEMKKKRIKEKEIKKQAEVEAEKQIKAMEMAYVISKMLGDK